MKRRLILHLGLSKTGTTTIQGFLRDHPEELSAAGILYPRLGVDLADHPAFSNTAHKAYLQKEASHLALSLELLNRRGANRADTAVPLWSAAIEQFRASDAQTAILSYENFGMQAEGHRFDLVAPMLREFDVTGLIYLRPQEDWVTSLYAQVIRGKDRLATPLAEFTVFKARDRLGFSHRLDAIRSHIPLDRLVVGTFDEARRTGLLEDFFDKAGLSRRPPLAAIDNAVTNATLPTWAVLFMLRCNQAGLADAFFLEVVAGLRRISRMVRSPFSLRSGLDIATPQERSILRGTTLDDATRLHDLYGVTLATTLRESIDFRPFDDEDFATVRSALIDGLSQEARAALERI